MQILDLVSLRFYKEAIINLCNKYHASNVQVFGSVARNEATEKSDIDLLVDFPLYTSALDYVALQRELTTLLQSNEVGCVRHVFLCRNAPIIKISL